MRNIINDDVKDFTKTIFDEIDSKIGNVVKCRSWIGLTEEELDTIREMLR
jgi:hypothetical protein